MNSEQYHFSDFTTKHYRELLKMAKSRFEFSDFPSCLAKEKFILWRHDVDFSLHEALRTASIEHEEGVSATYFIHLHSEFYNLLEKRSLDMVHQITSLGHDIGLHFDVHFYNIKSENELDQYIELEKKLIEQVFNLKINTFSFHNTNDFTLSCQKEKYAGLLNTYAGFFRNNVDYCSDSNGYWRFKRLENFLLETTNPKIQVLTHPEWWQESIMSPKERVWKCIDDTADRAKDFYVDALTTNGREVIDW